VQAQRFALNVLVAFIPAVVLGLALGSAIKATLFHPVPVALSFVVGGLIILWVERRHRDKFGAMDMEGTRRARVETVDDMTVMDALKVGLVQCAALIPGTSRSGATIIGAMLIGFSG
jgi:undecaprenyl-diphosphatase